MGFEGEKVGLIPGSAFPKAWDGSVALKPLCLHSTRASGERQGEPLVPGLPCFRASPFCRQSLGLLLTYSSCIGQALAILGAASLPQSVGRAGCSALCCEQRIFGGRLLCVPVSRSTAPAAGEPGLPSALPVQSKAGASKLWVQRGFPAKRSS